MIPGRKGVGRHTRMKRTDSVPFIVLALWRGVFVTFPIVTIPAIPLLTITVKRGLLYQHHDE